jgi:class 3 adenylate cyclase
MTLLTKLTPLLESLQTTYAVLDEAAQIVVHSPTVAAWLGAPGASLIGASLWDLVPELIGYEPALEQLQQGGPSLRLDHINRVAPDGSLRYFSLVMTHAPDLGEGAALLLVTDTSEYGRVLQAATQRRNELQLVRQELARVNGQLDYVLQHYLPSEVAEALLSGALQPNLGGELREITILFADVRGYTHISERLPPDELMSLLNGYLTVVIDMIDAAGGTLVHIQGDGVMAIFNAPIPQPDHARRAAEAACAMQRAVAGHAALYGGARPQLGFGIGLNTGVALVGNSGAPWRMIYTANGDSVNLAARITASAPAGAVWVSGSTAARLDNTVPRTPLPPLTFKGKSQATELWELGWADPVP